MLYGTMFKIKNGDIMAKACKSKKTKTPKPYGSK
jgi:hypothetical protein